MPSNKKLLGYVLVIAAAAMWSFLGPTYTILFSRYSLPLLSIVILRASISGLILLAASLCCYRQWIRIKRRHLPYFFLYGTIGIGAFFIIYLRAIKEVGISVGAVLLYTAPAWVAIISWAFLHEEMNGTVLLAVILSFTGAALVSGVYAPLEENLNAVGILWGIGAGIAYALWSVGTRIGVDRYGYSPWTVQLYGFLLGSLTMMLYQPVNVWWKPEMIKPALPWALFLGIVPSLGGAVTYSAGVKWLEVSKASIIATLEPVLATVWATLFFSEHLAPLQMVGGALIIVSVILMRPRREGRAIESNCPG